MRRASRLLLTQISAGLTPALSCVGFLSNFQTSYFSQGREFMSNISLTFGLDKNPHYNQEL